MKNFITRTLTGILFVAVLVSGICYHPFSFACLFALITGGALWEFYGLVRLEKGTARQQAVHVLAGVYLFGASFAYASGLAASDVFLPYLLFIIYAFIGQLYYKATDPIQNWAKLFLGQIYCAGSFSLLNFVILPDRADGNAGFAPLLALSLFIFVWLNDTGAFLVGSMIGKRRLFERISPKKSWEGFFGGLAFALLASQVFAWLDPQTEWYKWLGLAAVIVAFGTWGDLTESLLKRTLGVKDSGKVLPGHGGMLDRFDSVILSIPAAYIYIRLFIQS